MEKKPTYLSVKPRPQIKTKEILHPGELRYSDLITTLQEGLVLYKLVYSTSGEVTDYQIIDVNPAFEKILGIKAADVKNHLVTELDGITLAPYLNIYSHVLETGQTKTFESYFPPLDKYFRIVAFSPSDGMFATLFEDITEITLSLKALEKSESEYRQLFENSISAISHVLPNGRLIRVNTAYAEMYGFSSPEEMMAEVTNVNYLYANLKDQKSVLKTLITEGVMKPREMVVIRRDRTQLTVLVSAQVIRDIEGNLQCYQAIHVDITDRKQTEEKLRLAMARLNEAQEIGNMGSFSIEIANHCIITSPKLDKFLGIDPDQEKTSHFWSELLHPDDQKEFESSLASCIEFGIPFDKEFRFIRRSDGQIRWLHWIVKGEQDDSGKVIRCMGIVVDITERKFSEEILKSNEARFRAIFEQVAIGVAQVDTETGQYIYINQKYCDLLGYTIPEMLDKTFIDVSHPDDVQFNLENTAKLIAGEITEFSYEKRFIRKDGSIMWGLLTASPMWRPEEKPEKYYHIAIVEDITVRKKTLEMLQEKQDLLRSLTIYWHSAIENERKSIAREIHDEFGQSMTALKMDLDWLVDHLPKDDEKIGRILGMNKLVSDSFSLMRRIATDLRPTMLDDLGLNATLEWQAREFSNRSGIRCELNLQALPDNLDPVLITNLYRIFQESLTNVSRHSLATLVSVTLEMKDYTIFLTIEDNGRGISESEKNNRHSLGLLGLKERASIYGGCLEIAGVPGSGTKITTRIPLVASYLDGAEK